MLPHHIRSGFAYPTGGLPHCGCSVGVNTLSPDPVYYRSTLDKLAFRIEHAILALKNSSAAGEHTHDPLVRKAPEEEAFSDMADAMIRRLETMRSEVLQKADIERPAQAAERARQLLALYEAGAMDVHVARELTEHTPRTHQELLKYPADLRAALSRTELILAVKEKTGADIVVDGHFFD